MSLANDNDVPLFVEFKPGFRRRVERAIDSLVALLDQIDADPDFEEEPDLEDGFDQEQELGATGVINQEKAWGGSRRVEYGLTNSDGDLEFDGETAESADDEPSLGSVGQLSERHDQGLWALGASDDREDEHDGREPDVDGEPSLGSIGQGDARYSQFCWAHGSSDDLEENIGPDDREGDDAEHGIADRDAIMEVGFTFLGVAE
ncbi:MAG: hypothetical protein EKK29_08050 [Hyphomicrobiales bacterium]|nr:MAG: hypothetical protein EKK29_08050 [Hyphomicrobiales bacterium]